MLADLGCRGADRSWPTPALPGRILRRMIPDRHQGPIGQLGRLVVDLRLTGVRVEYSGAQVVPHEGGSAWGFKVVEFDRAGAEVWRAAAVSQFEWKSAEDVLGRVRERWPKVR